MAILLCYLSVNRGAWVAYLVKSSTLGFGSGRDLTVLRSSPESCVGSALGVEPAWDSLLFSLCPSPGCMSFLVLSLKINKHKKKKCKHLRRTKNELKKAFL